MTTMNDGPENENSSVSTPQRNARNASMPVGGKLSGSCSSMDERDMRAFAFSSNIF